MEEESSPGEWRQRQLYVTAWVSDSPDEHGRDDSDRPERSKALTEAMHRVNTISRKERV